MTDVIRRTGSVKGGRSLSEGGSRIAARLSSPPQVLHGAQSGDVQLTELTSGRPLYRLGNPRRAVTFSCKESKLDV